MDDATPVTDWTRYGAPIDFDNPGDSRALVLGRVAEQPHRILELGCSAGLMTRVLHERGHQVTGVEIDPVAADLAAPYAERMIVGDLDAVDADGRHLLDDVLLDDGQAAAFDTLIAADVLEHLRDPVGCLRRALDLLSADGEVILSIPNVAHGDVRLALLEGRFDYRDNGLLDRTHVHMFTLSSLLGMLREVGLAPVRWDRAIWAMGDTEIDIDESLLEFGRRALADDPEINTYQWIVTCRRADSAGDAAVWPETADPRTVVNGVLDVMNAPVEHPGAAAAEATGGTPSGPVAGARLAGARFDGVRRVAAVGRSRLSSLISR